MKRGRSGAVTLVLCFVAMIAIVGAITFSHDEKEPEEEKLAITEEETVEEEEEETEFTQGEEVEAEFEEPDDTKTEAPVVEDPLTFSPDTILTWPIDGNVLMNYSMDETVYFATLDQYKYHPAIIISGEVGQEVWSAKEGRITEIRSDAQTGLTVKMDLGDGYEAVYGQLKNVQKKEGQKIEKGELLGYLSEPTKYYSVEGCNLYFQLLKDGEPTNPLEYLDI